MFGGIGTFRNSQHQMKATRRLLITSALLLLGAYSIYTTVRVQQLEARLRQEPIKPPSTSQITYAFDPSTSQITYAFDDSFREYFGEKGVAAVEQALQILRIPKTERAPKIEELHLDFLTDPLRLDGKKE